MKKATPLKAIRAKCLDCCCHQSNEVKLCAAINCPLHSFRFGKNPNLQGKGQGNPNIKYYSKYAK